MGKWCLHASLFLGNKDMFKNYKRFDFWHVQTADIGGTKPWKNNCSLIWKLYKFLMTLLAGLFEMRGCWHIGLRWAIVALWATCFRIWTSATPRPIPNGIWQSVRLHLVDINAYVKCDQNIPNGLRVIDLFHEQACVKITFSEFEPRQRLGQSQMIFDNFWAISCQYQCVCKILSEYSKRFKSYRRF